jgi:hypothetical protein
MHSVPLGDDEFKEFEVKLKVCLEKRGKTCRLCGEPEHAVTPCDLVI